MAGSLEDVYSTKYEIYKYVITYLLYICHYIFTTCMSLHIYYIYVRGTCVFCIYVRYVYFYIFVCTCLYVCTYVYVDMYMNICMDTYARHINVHAYMYDDEHTRIYV